MTPERWLAYSDRMSDRRLVEGMQGPCLAWLPPSGVFLVVAGVVAMFGWNARIAASGSSGSPAQALRTCVDRWNQDTMVSWGSMSVRIAIRALNARERGSVSFGNDAQQRCTVSLADRPGENTWICRIGASEAYVCPLVTSDGMPPLTKTNGSTNKRGLIKLDVPLAGTRPTPPLAWQRRYPHIDGFILPWTGAGTLRSGLRFVRVERGGCGSFVETRVPRNAGRCVDGRTAAWTEPCFPQRGTFRVGDLAACTAPCLTRFTRWRVTARS
jgi:hypothetical protein